MKKYWYVFHDLPNSSRKNIVAVFESHQAAYAHCAKDFKLNRFNENWLPLQVTFSYNIVSKK